MWSNLPFDLLANIFSFLPADSLALASSVCKHWHTCVTAYPATAAGARNPPWFVALPVRNRGHTCYTHNPIIDTWHGLFLGFLPHAIRPVASIGGLVLLRSTTSTTLQLAICNLFTKRYWSLPMLNIARTNPAVGVVFGLDESPDVRFSSFRVYVAGGMSEAPSGGAAYEPTLEMYDSWHDRWDIIGRMPVEFAVRLTVWSPNESVYSGGVLYWMTSARAYSVMGLDIESNSWRELSVPMAERLEFAALVRWNGRPTLVGGTCNEGACIWELGEGDTWELVEKIPIELGMRLLGVKGSWESTKCVGSDGALCLYRDLGSGMVVWREVEKGRWEWLWVEGCCSVGGKQVQNIPIKGLLLHPNLATSGFPDK